MDISNLSKEELIELRTMVNARIASLAALEKRKSKPEELRKRNYLFKTYELAKAFYEEDVNGKCEFISVGGFYNHYMVTVNCSKEFNNNLKEKYEVSRLYYGNEGNNWSTNEHKIGHLVGNTYILNRR